MISFTPSCDLMKNPVGKPYPNPRNPASRMTKSNKGAPSTIARRAKPKRHPLK